MRWHILSPSPQASFNFDEDTPAYLPSRTGSHLTTMPRHKKYKKPKKTKLETIKEVDETHALANATNRAPTTQAQATSPARRFDHYIATDDIPYIVIFAGLVGFYLTLNATRYPLETAFFGFWSGFFMQRFFGARVREVKFLEKLGI